MIPLCSHVQWRQSILEHRRQAEFIVLPFKREYAQHKIQYKCEQMKTLDLHTEIPSLFKRFCGNCFELQLLSKLVLLLLKSIKNKFSTIISFSDLKNSVNCTKVHY